ncbi:unnamed protein product [Sphenostylis stenocarpa]|uniref:Uncharacterized protein n=1 Tax=Sphenostylis stenocarpa TaxID=92480 RepID=A0AA86S6J6_9FABA|nr:unnamed protein product [Sphenostylis stenocarpa]
MVLPQFDTLRLQSYMDNALFRTHVKNILQLHLLSIAILYPLRLFLFHSLSNHATAATNGIFWFQRTPAVSQRGRRGFLGSLFYLDGSDCPNCRVLKEREKGPLPTSLSLSDFCLFFGSVFLSLNRSSISTLTFNYILYA